MYGVCVCIVWYVRVYGLCVYGMCVCMGCACVLFVCVNRKYLMLNIGVSMKGSIRQNNRAHILYQINHFNIISDHCLCAGAILKNRPVC